MKFQHFVAAIILLSAPSRSLGRDHVSSLRPHAGNLVEAIGARTPRIPGLERHVDNKSNLQATCIKLMGKCTIKVAPGLNTLQDAIDESGEGEIICLDPGLFESTDDVVVVDKALEIRGSKRSDVDLDDVDNDGFSEALIVGTISILECDTIVNGLTIAGPAGNFDSIRIRDGGRVRNIYIGFNVIRDNQVAHDGIEMRFCTNCVIEYNSIFNFGEQAINVESGNDILVSSNEIYDLDANSTLADGIDFDNCTDIEASDNIVRSIDASSLGGFDAIHGGDISGGKFFRNHLYDFIGIEDFIEVEGTNTDLEFVGNWLHDFL